MGKRKSMLIQDNFLVNWKKENWNYQRLIVNL